MTRLKILTLITESENIKKLYYKASKPMLTLSLEMNLSCKKN